MKTLYSASLILAILVLFCFVTTPVEAISSPCTYCTYCTYCDYCSQCPCDASQNKNCDACKYCTYCKLCSMCNSVCGVGGISDKLSSLWSSITSKLGYSVEHLSDDEIHNDLKKYDIPPKTKTEL